MKEQKRLLPLDDDCMKNKRIDYKLFSLLQSLSKFNEKTKVRYVPKQHPDHGSITRPKLLELYNKNCQEQKDLISLRTMKTRITLFKGIGMNSYNPALVSRPLLTKSNECNELDFVGKD